MKRIMKWIAALSICGLAAPLVAQPDDGLKVIDLTDDYERVWTEIQTLPAERRVAEFKRKWAEILPGFYNAERLAFFGVTPAKYDEFLGGVLAGYPKRRAGIQRVAREFGQLSAPAIRSFEAEFGPMRGYPPVYLVNSHNEFDGGTRDLPGGTRLLFGADMIDTLYKDAPVQPFFHHELFHLYHQRNFGCEEAWCSLWSEGLATYVASRLNPDADDRALLLAYPVPLRPAVEANRKEAACAIAAVFDSPQGADTAPIFSSGEPPFSANLPRRFGYVVGLMVAQDLGRTRSLKQLASLRPAEAKPLVRAALGRLADCG